MRYLVILGLSLLVWGCDEEPPGPDPKPRTKDLIGVGVVEADDGEIWVLTQEVDRLEDVEPVELDDSPAPPEPAYYFRSMTVKLHSANGQRFQSIGGGEYEYGMVHYYDRVTDGYLVAGINFSYCGDHYTPRALPSVAVRDENYQTIRWAQTTCEYGYALGDEWDETRISPMQVVALANGDLLYWGLSAIGGPARLTCVTEYGQAVWSQIRQEGIDASAISAMQYGGYAIVDQSENAVSWFDNGGIFVHSVEIGANNPNIAYSITQMPDSDYVIAGVSREGNDPYVWTYSADFTLLDEATVSYLNCLDSVAVQAINNDILLICKAGEGCGRPGAQRLLLLNRDLTTIAQESFGGETNVVVKEVHVSDDGSLFVCGAFDRGNGSYSALVSKYDASLNAVWSTTVHPNM